MDRQIVKAITDSFGKEIWRRGLVVLTHAQVSPPDGLSYDEFTSRRSEALLKIVRLGARMKKQEIKVGHDHYFLPRLKQIFRVLPILFHFPESNFLWHNIIAFVSYLTFLCSIPFCLQKKSWMLSSQVKGNGTWILEPLLSSLHSKMPGPDTLIRIILLHFTQLTSFLCN